MQTERQTLDGLFSASYVDLCRLAVVVRRDYRQNTLSASSLVNEAWLKLTASPGCSYRSRLHFNRIVGRAMRQVLVEMTRRRKAAKRGSDVTFVALGHSGGESITDDRTVALHRVLGDLARRHPRQARVVRYRFFTGLQLAEIATAMGVSEATVERDWRAARTWLAIELRRES